jgi:hypothetical protein
MVCHSPPGGTGHANARRSPLPTQNSHSPRPSDLTARFQRPAAVYSRPRYSPLYPGTVNSEPGAGRSGFSYRIPRVTDRACTHTHTLAHCTVQCRVVPTLLLELQTQPSRSEIYTFLQEVEVYSVRHVIVLCRDFGSRESIISSARLRNAAPEYGAERG